MTYYLTYERGNVEETIVASLETINRMFDEYRTENEGFQPVLICETIDAEHCVMSFRMTTLGQW